MGCKSQHKVTRNRFRIYLKLNQNGRIEQAPPYTGLFYDVDQARSIESDGTLWYKIVATSTGLVANTLYEADIEGVNSGITTTALGARMRLHNDRWYADAADVDLNAGIRMNDLPVTFLKFVVVGMLIAEALYLYIGRMNDWNLRPVAIAGAIIGSGMLAADAFLQWRRDRK